MVAPTHRLVGETKAGDRLTIDSLDAAIETFASRVQNQVTAPFLDQLAAAINEYFVGVGLEIGDRDARLLLKFMGVYLRMEEGLGRRDAQDYVRLFLAGRVRVEGGKRPPEEE